MRVLVMLLVLLPAITAAALAEPPRRVGKLGDVKRIEFRGNRLFDAAAIRSGLNTSLPYLTASRPSSPLKELLESLREGVRGGYLPAGFANVNVKVTLNAVGDGSIIVVDEGSRYRSGSVRVEGVSRQLARHIGRHIADPPLSKGKLNEAQENVITDDEKPLWTEGKPPALDEVSIARISPRITEALKEFGYYFVRCDVSRQLNPSQQTAELVVTITTLGPRAIIDRVAISGNRKHSDDDVLKYLDLRTPTPYSLRLLSDVKSKLRKSARFWKYSVSLKREHRWSEKLTMRIVLDEYAAAPSLNKSFAPTDEAVLRLCTWINDFDNSDDDVVVSFTSNKLAGEANDVTGRFSFVLSPREGLVLEYDIKGSSWGTFHHALLFTPRRWAIHLPHRKTKYDATSPFGYRPSCSLSLVPSDSDPREEHKANFRFGFGLNWLDKGEALHRFAPKMSIEPAVFLHGVRRESTTMSIERGILNIISEQGKLRSDATTGRLIEWNVTDKDERYTLRVVTQKRALKAKIADFDARARKYRTAYDPKAPAVSFLSLAAEEMVASSHMNEKLTVDERRRLQATVRRLIWV